MKKFALNHVKPGGSIRVFTLVGLILLAAGTTRATVTVTAATGGSAINANTTGSANWTALTGPTIAEGATGDITTGTIILNAPSGFVFRTGSSVTVSVNNSGSGNRLTVSSTTATVTASTISITISQSSGGSRRGTIVWSGIQVQPNVSAPGLTGNLTKTGTSSYTASSANYGTLTQAAVAVSKLNFTSAVYTNAAGTSRTLTVQRQDANGNPVTAETTRTVTITSSSGSGTITSTPLTITTNNSSATFNYTDTQAGTVTLTAASTSPSTVTSATQTDRITNTSPNKLVFTSIPVSGTAGNTFSVTVQAQDTYGNPAPVSANTTITLALGSGSGTLGGTLSGSMSAGTSNLTLNAASYNRADTITLTASASGGNTLTSGTSGNIPFSPGAVHHFSITPATTATATAGVAISGFTITAQDSNSNTVTAFTDTVNFSGTAGITGTSPSFIAGVASGLSLTPIVAGSGMTLVAADTGGHTGTAAFTTVSPNQLTHYHVTFTPAPYYVDIPFTTLVYAHDAYNNQVTTNAGRVQLSSSAPDIAFDADGHGSFYTNASESTITVTNGLGTIATKSLIAQTNVTITATDTNGLTGTSIAIDFDSAADAYRTKSSGNWNDAAIWQRYDGTTWQDAGNVPGYTNGVITISNTHLVSITADTIVDQVHIEGAISINNGVTAIITNGASPSFENYGMITNRGVLLIASNANFYNFDPAVVANAGTITKLGSMRFFGGTYDHQLTTNAGTIPAIVWLENATCRISGFTTNTATPGGLNQRFLNVVWDCPNQTGMISLGSGFTTANALNITNTGSGAVSMASDLTATNGLTLAGTANLDCGAYTVNGASFTMDSGAILGIGSAAGIALSGANGNIQTATRIFATGGRYHYHGSAAQNTGSGLPSSVESLTNNNSGGTLTLDQPTTIASTLAITTGGKLSLPSGISTTPNLILGTTAKSTGTWGSSTANPAAGHINDTFFAGQGTVSVTTGVAPLVSIVSDTNPSLPDSAVTFTATVSGPNGTPGGTVQFAADNSDFGSPATLSGGSAATANSVLSHGLHTITASYSGDDNFNPATGTMGTNQIINTPPTANTNAFQAYQNTSLNISAATLASINYDADGDALNITAVSNGQFGTATLNNGVISYVPQTGYVGNDTFSFTLSDGFTGGTNTCAGQVTISIAQGATSSFTRVTPPVNNTVFLQGYGIPGRVYDVQRSPAVNFSSYTTLGTVTSAPNAVITFTDDSATGAANYYRFKVH